MDDLLQFPNITSVLETYAEELRKLYRENLVKSDALATEQLYNTATYQVTRDGLTWEVSLSLEDYWKYVEEGTKPHWPSEEAITKWVRVKPVIPRTMPSGESLRRSLWSISSAARLHARGRRGGSTYSMPSRSATADSCETLRPPASWTSTTLQALPFNPSPINPCRNQTKIKQRG